MISQLPYAFNYSADNWTAGTPGVVGTLLPEVTAADTMTADTDCITTPLAQDCYAISVLPFNTFVTGTDTSALMDILYDPAGGTSYQILIPKLVCGFLSSTVNTYWFPLYVPKGSTIGARWQCVTDTTATPRVAITLWGGPSRPGFWFGTNVTAVGTNTTGSEGTTIDPGSTGTYGSWASVGGTSNPAFRFINFGFQGTLDTHTADTYFVQYGFGSTKIPGAQTRHTFTTAEVINQFPQTYGVYADIPAGTQLQARATGSDATSEDCSVAIYGVS